MCHLRTDLGSSVLAASQLHVLVQKWWASKQPPSGLVASVAHRSHHGLTISICRAAQRLLLPESRPSGLPRDCPVKPCSLPCRIWWASRSRSSSATPSGRASWTIGSSMTSPLLPTSCVLPAVPPPSAWAPAKPGGSGSSMLSVSLSARPFPSRPATSGTTSTSTWMPGATNSNASRRKGSEPHQRRSTPPGTWTAQPFICLPSATVSLDEGRREPPRSLTLLMPLMLSRSHSWTATSTPALATEGAEWRGTAGGVSSKGVGLRKKVLFLFPGFLFFGGKRGFFPWLSNPRTPCECPDLQAVSLSSSNPTLKSRDG